MHAGMANNGNDQRAHGGKFTAASAKTIMPAGILNEKCTPAWLTTAAAGGHTVPNSPSPAARRPCRRGYKTKNARRHGEQRQRPAGTRRQISPPAQSKRPCRRGYKTKNARR
ncbi:MAG: hypothetical protein ACLR23_27800 [Clostridia bacterium]